MTYFGTLSFRKFQSTAALIVLCFPLLAASAGISVPADRGRKLGLGPGLAREPRPQTRRCARRVGRRGRAGSHLGTSGWRPGRCAGPSSHWGGCWPSPASSTAWFGRLRLAEARGRDASRSRSPDTHRAAPQPRRREAVVFAAPPRTSRSAWERPRGGGTRTRGGRTLPTACRAGQGSDAGLRGRRYGPAAGPLPLPDDSAAGAGRKAQSGSGDAWGAGPAPGSPERPGLPARALPRCRSSAALLPAAPGPTCTPRTPG